MHQQLQQSIDDVVAQHGTVKRDGWPQLNQVITSLNSAKIVMSRIYAQELLNRGFVIDTALEMPKPSAVPDTELDRYFNGARGRVMVIGIEEDTAQRAELASGIARAIKSQDSIFVLYGKRENVENFFAAHPSLQDLFKNTLRLGEPTPEDLERKRKEDIVAQWRETRGTDIITVGHTVAAPEKAAFTKKQHPKPV